MPGKKRKHVPIQSEAQRRLFGAVASGTAMAAKGLTKKKAKKFLKEAKGKDLPERKQVRAQAAAGRSTAKNPSHGVVMKPVYETKHGRIVEGGILHGQPAGGGSWVQAGYHGRTLGRYHGRTVGITHRKK